MSKNRKWLLPLCLFIIVIILEAAALYGTSHRSRGVTLYFVRHGQTDTNVAGLLVGTSGNPTLTETGEEMAAQLGEGLSDITFDAAYASTLTRAYDTASLVLSAAGQGDLPITQLEGLQDISWGDAEGMTSDEMYEKFGISTPAEAFGDVDDAEFVSPINAESKYDFCERFEDAVFEILEAQEDGDTVLVVAHSSMDFFFQKYFPEQAGGGVENLSVTILRYEDGAFTLVDYNDTSYLQ
ncbi:MAG: histidine phosphatase family protein [Lachnospiraceae bacterium]|nr:histidine phosphatase family protein [Lachnospiraceae bacterium]